MRDEKNDGTTEPLRTNVHTWRPALLWLFREPSCAMGHVVDFIPLPNFAMFNVADSAVVSGVVIICLLTLRGIGLDGSRQHSSGSRAATLDKAATPDHEESGDV